MDLRNFEQRNLSQEKFIQAEALGETDATFTTNEVEKIKRKLEARKRQQKKLKNIFGFLGAVILLLVLFAGYSQYRLYTLGKDEKVTSEDSTIVSATTTPQEIIARISRHILLPEGSPQIAEVRDVEKLRDTQAFFKNAENGDIIILYETTIFIYRPSKDIIIASGDITGLNQPKP